ncbi:methyl-accepting chemotaxis protein [Bdellovibrio sp. KM01]|uniref:methyl-accepting chemotaxis protein n=1 Tax=Bdellovibrio sp. KM01 TaxID=2748865 RepID=UPI001C675743|nr:methyl-accepting chemotaxis protein [Bdellovibrio sp. KM01]
MKNWSLNKKILLGSLVMLVIVLMSLAYTGFSINRSVRAELGYQRELISKGVRGQLAQMRDSAPVYAAVVQGALERLQTLVVSKGPISINTVKNIEIINGEKVPSLEVNGNELSKNFVATDKVKEEFGSTATIFVRRGADFIRISTNVVQEDGSRAVGTKLSIQGPAYSALIKGQSYFGQSQILNKPYFTGYKPIFSQDKEVIGAWYSGYILKSLVATVDFVEHSQILQKGFFVLYKNEDGAIRMISKRDDKELNSEIYLGWLQNNNISELNLESWNYRKSEETDGYILVSAIYEPDVTAKVISSTLTASGSLAFVILALLLISVVFARKLERTLSAVAADAERVGVTVTTTAGQMTSTGTHLSEGAIQAAASIEESVASLEELVSMVSRNAQSAQSANKLTAEASALTSKGSGQIGGLMAAMVEIEQSSKKMSEIISVIDDIAFQTNLLSLNASVEAARAGEHGKGFAVVADAVRSLAHKSAESAGNISKIISEIVKKISDGNRIAESNAKSFGEITQAIKELNVIVGEIAKASDEQSLGLKQISIAMNQFDQTTQNNASAAEEAAQASQDLSKNAEELSRVVSDLKILIKGSGYEGSEMVI